MGSLGDQVDQQIRAACKLAATAHAGGSADDLFTAVMAELHERMPSRKWQDVEDQFRDWARNLAETGKDEPPVARSVR
jgi:hypothetical protein